MSLVASALLPVIVPPHGIASAVAQVSLDGTAGVVTQIVNSEESPIVVLVEYTLT